MLHVHVQACDIEYCVASTFVMQLQAHRCADKCLDNNLCPSAQSFYPMQTGRFADRLLSGTMFKALLYSTTLWQIAGVHLPQ